MIESVKAASDIYCPGLAGEVIIANNQDAVDAPIRQRRRTPTPAWLFSSNRPTPPTDVAQTPPTTKRNRLISVPRPDRGVSWRAP